MEYSGIQQSTAEYSRVQQSTSVLRRIAEQSRAAEYSSVQ